MSLPPLPRIALDTIPSLTSPTPLIRSEADVGEWHKSEGFANYELFVQRLNEAVVGHNLGEELEESSPVSQLSVPSIMSLTYRFAYHH